MAYYKFPLEPETDDRDRDGGGTWEGAFPAHANGGHLYQDWNSFKAVTIAEATALSLGAHPATIFDFLSQGGTLHAGLYTSITDGLVRAVLSGDIKTVALDTPILKSDVTSDTLVITEDVYNYFESQLKKETSETTGTQEKNNYKQVISETEQKKLLKQIGALALLLSKKINTYRKSSDEPNTSQIANAVDEMLGFLPDANIKGLSNYSLRASITEGLALLHK
jgi:hypothetical protein